MSAGIDILNCAAGHTEIRFEGDVLEVERAKRIIQDMLRRGYAMFVHGEGDALHRVESFDPEKRVYLIADGPLYAGDQSPGVEAESSGEGDPVSAGAPKRRRQRRTLVPMEEVKVTAIGRSAGG